MQYITLCTGEKLPETPIRCVCKVNVRFLVPSESIWMVVVMMSLPCCFAPDESVLHALLAFRNRQNNFWPFPRGVLYWTFLKKSSCFWYREVSHPCSWALLEAEMRWRQSYSADKGGQYLFLHLSSWVTSIQARSQIQNPSPSLFILKVALADGAGLVANLLNGPWDHHLDAAASLHQILPVRWRFPSQLEDSSAHSFSAVADGNELTESLWPPKLKKCLYWFSQPQVAPGRDGFGWKECEANVVIHTCPVWFESESSLSPSH